METQSGDGGEVLRGAEATGSSALAGRVHAKEDLEESKRVERFNIPLQRLKMMFEKPPASSMEVTELHSPAHSSAPLHKNKESAGDKMSNQGADLDPSAGSAGISELRQKNGEGEESITHAHPEGEPETISVKQRLALYQAAVSKEEKSTSTGVMEDSEACSVPGGLASVKKQFESQQDFSSTSSHSTVTQFHFQQRRETSSSSEVTVRSSVPSTQLLTLTHGSEDSHDQRAHQHVASSFEDHYDETVRVIGGEDLPKVSTRVLKQQHEKSIEDATPSKHVKIDFDTSQFQWAPVNVSSMATTGGGYESKAVTRKVKEASSSTSMSTSSTSMSASAASMSASAASMSASADYEALEHLPPPPPTEFVQIPAEVPERCVSPQPAEQGGSPRYTMSKEQYSKQRNLYELKRLYKHIHPEVRKNLERDFFSEVTEMEQGHMDSEEELSGDVQQARYVFENSGSGSPSKCMSPEREYLEWDEILKGEVQSMRWMFENKPLDSIKDDLPDEDNLRNIAQQEIIAGKDVKYTTWMFENQPMDALGIDTPDSVEHTGKLTELARGDVQTATWLFETQPLDTLNKIYQEDDQSTEVVYTKDIAGGDVKTARYLFETQHLDTLGHTETIDESHFLQLKSELEEVKGEVRTTTRMFETQPMCVIRGDSGEMLEIKTVRREETEKGDVKTSRWLFETQPLDVINKDPTQVKLICGVSMEETDQGGVNHGRWLFETKTLDSIKDEEWESSRMQKEEILGADVRKHCMVFETQPMDSLKDNANARRLSTDDIMGGDVTSARHLFETVPMENLKDLPEVGKLKKVVTSEEERGDVRHQRWMFESKPLEQIREEKKEITRTVNLEELDRGNVTNYKEKFETMDLSKCEGTQKIQVEGVTSGSVKSNKVLFESTPLYAMQDSSGQYHEVKTIRREEIVKGDVRSCKWMFETRPIDQFDESINKFQIIKGISKEEIESGDVKTAKWLFETQPLDAIKFFSDVEEEENKRMEGVEIEKGDVKTCRWLFETQPMDVLYEKVEAKTDTEATEVQKGDVKTCTWLFETQTLDSIRDESETVLQTCTVKQEDVQGKDVRLARFLFETENLENITGEDHNDFKRVTEIDIQSGDVSRMKYIFENQSSDIMTSTSEETMQKLKSHQTEDIQKGNVVNCTWMFENQPIDTIRENSEESKDVRTVTDVQGGNVDNGRFIFETYSLDKIQEESSETEIKKLQSIIREEIERGDVKNYTMMFETQPLYAIRDKEGHYHEVTTVTKEEILRGDVVGARWLFETRPLDSIKDTDEVYIIKAVTEEDVQKGDVSSARWRFETQPLDEIAEELKVKIKTVEDIQGGDVRTNKQRFEKDDMSQKCVRTVSVSEIQKGNVRSSTWMFETRTIDQIHGEGSELDEMVKVTREEVVKGDVKQSVWLFEKEPLDRIKDTDETETIITREVIPQADVKTTTWLFETTPLTEFNESNVEKTEIIGKSIKDTLEELYCQKMVDSQGILIETDEIGDVRMAKYKLMNQDCPEIQREEVIRGDLNNIMMNLLNRRETTERGITIDVEERGNINTTVKQLFNQERGVNVEKEEIIKGDIQEAINNLLKEEGSAKRGILIQEDEKGDVRMTIYSLLNKEEGGSFEKEDVVKGNVRGTLHRLLSNPDAKGQSPKIKVGDTERGNVSFYSTCIESGALDYLRQLQFESDETLNESVRENIIGGDVENTKLILKRNQLAIGRTVAVDDIVPGDVHSTVKVFMMEPQITLHNLQKEEIIKGDLRVALDSLTEAVNQRVVIEKEEVVRGDINTTLRSLEEAQHQLKEIEKPEIVHGDIRGALQSLGKSATNKTDVIIEDLVPGDIKGTLRSLEEAKQVVKEVEKEEIVKGDIHTALLNLHEASTEKKVFHHQVSEQGDVRGTIQLLMEPAASPRMQRRASTEGDIRTSIKSLYDQEQTQIEKEEVMKGDVQGTIKSLMQKKQQSSHRGKMNPYRGGQAPTRNPRPVQPGVIQCPIEPKTNSKSENPVPAVKNLPSASQSQSSTQKHSETRSESSQMPTQEQHSSNSQVTAVSKSESSQVSQKMSATEQSVKQKTVPSGKVQIKKKNVSKQKTESVVVSPGTTVAKESSETNISTKQTQEIKTVTQVQTTVTTEHKSVSEKQSVKNMKSEQSVKNVKSEQSVKNLNRNFNPKGLIKKGKQQPKIHFPPPPVSPPPPSESELSLPPPPSPVTESDLQPSLSPCSPLVTRQDSDLPLPPPPPPVTESEPEFFPPPPPPPPPPSMAGQDFLPPPPPQQEFSSVAQPAPAKSKGRTLFKVPKPEPPKQPEPPKFKWQKKPMPPAPPPPPSPPAEIKQQKESESLNITTLTVKTEKNTMTEKKVKSPEPPVLSPTKVPSEIPGAKPQSEEPSTPPPKKVFVPPIKIPPPPAPVEAPKAKTYARKFKTPLMLAEERYRKQREETEKDKAPITIPIPPTALKTETDSTEQKTDQTEIAPTEHQETPKEPEPGVEPVVVPPEPPVTTIASKVLPAPPMQKMSANVTASKPLFPKFNRKVAHESVNAASDRKQADQSNLIFSENQHAVSDSSKMQNVSSATHNQAVREIKAQASSTMISPTTAAQDESVKACSEGTTSTQDISQASASILNKSTVSVKAVEIKNIENQEVKKVASQPKKMPKVTPSFKVKTINVPKIEKPEMQAEKEIVQKDQTVTEVSAQHNQRDTQGVSSMSLVQESLQVSTCSTEKIEVQVEKQGQEEQVIKDSKQDVQTKKPKQMPKKEQKQPPPVLPKPTKQPLLKVSPAQGHMTVVESHQAVREEHVQIHKEMVVTESTVQHKSIQQQKGKLQVKKTKGSQHQQSKEDASKQHVMSEERAKEEQEEVKKEGEMQGEVAQSVTETSDSQKREEVQKLLSHIKGMQAVSGKMDPNSVRTMLSIVPDWLMEPEEKEQLCRVQYSKQKMKEIVVYVRNIAQAKLIFLEGSLSTFEKPNSEHTQEPEASSKAMQKISKISIGSAKVDTQKRVVEEKRTVQEQSESKTTEARMQSDLRMRTPSPTFICIESSRRTDSPHGVTPSPPASNRSASTPTPPPRWCDSPSSRVTRVSPSPTLSRSEKLAKLKDTTAKLSQGMTPPPMPLPEHMMRVQASEEEETRSSSRQEVTMEADMVEGTMMDVSEMVDSMMTVRDKREFFEEAQRAEVTRSYVRKDPIDIPERLGLDAEETEIHETEIHERFKEDLPRVDLSRLVNKFESPQPKVYVRREPIVIAERLGSDTEDAEADPEKKAVQAEEMTSFDIKAIKNVFEAGEQSQHHIRDKKNNLEKDTETADPSGFSETQSVTEKFSSVDEFGNTITGSQSQMTSHSESVTMLRDPPTYADVVRGSVPVLSVSPEASAEDLLRRFQKSWAESENVFKNLGFTVSEQHSSQSVTHQRQTVVTENTGARVRTVSGMSEEGLPHGVSHGGQAKLP